MTGRLRRTRCLVGYWHAETLLAHPYPRGEPVGLTDEDLTVLARFTEWATPEQVTAALPDQDPDALRKRIDGLCEAGLLLAEDTEPARRDDHVAQQWAAWSPQAPFLHYTTQDVTPTATSQDQPPAPAALFTTYPDADRILLPRLPADLDAPFGQVLYQRRTHYTFRDEPVPLETLAALLAIVFGPVDFLDAGPHGPLYRRTTPCAGARQELEGYLAIRDVTGIEPGWYHYNAAEHSLELRTEGCTGDDLTTLCMGQDHAGQAAFLAVLVAVIARQTGHHDTARSYRVCLLDAGHLGQTFTLAATALGLGSFPLAAYHDTTLTEHLAVDGVTHVPLHLLGAGTPTDNPNPYVRTAGLGTFRHAGPGPGRTRSA